MPISIRFALRSPRKNQSFSNPHPLEVWIRVNGKRAHFGAVWPVQTGKKLEVNPAEWNVAQQRSTRRDDPIGKQLTALKAHIEHIFDKQCALGAPTLESVVYELTEQVPPIYDPKRGWILSREIEERPGYSALTEETSLLDAFTIFAIEMRLKIGTITKRSDHVKLGRWDRGLTLLKSWETQKGRKVPPCYRITLSWLNEYHSWLVGQVSEKQAKPISEAMASRYIGQIGKVLQWMVEDELLTHNSVKKRTWPRYDDKEITFLEPEQVKYLFTLKWRKTKGIALWWFLLMCCTGLDYPDAVQYAHNRAALERNGPAGRKLVGRRLKPPHEEYDVPLLDEVELLFSRVSKVPRDISADRVNNYTADMEDELEVDWRITCKIARKTFGCLMLINGYYIGEVSRMLGHKRISTTEQHYAKIIGTAIDRARMRIGKTSLL